MAKAKDTRERVENALELLGIARLPNQYIVQVAAIKIFALTLLYIGDQLGFLNSTMENIEKHTQRMQ